MDIRYVHFKKRIYYMQNVEKILFQVVDVSKSLLYNKVQAQTEFLSLINATVSHEMRNPLNSILNQNLNLHNILKEMKTIVD